jgi:hypothetical protein
MSPQIFHAMAASLEATTMRAALPADPMRTRSGRKCIALQFAAMARIQRKTAWNSIRRSARFTSAPATVRHCFGWQNRGRAGIACEAYDETGLAKRFPYLTSMAEMQGYFEPRKAG